MTMQHLAYFYHSFTHTFFAQKTAYQSLVMGFYAILITQIARPIGGLIFGTIGDKYGHKS